MKKTILEIHDEINCHFVDLPVEHRRYLCNKYKIFNPANRYLPAVRLGRWDGKVPFFTLAGHTYINMLPDIIEYLYNQNFDIELHDTRTYNRVFDIDKVSEDSYSHITWPVGHQLAGQPIMLRDYQVDAINSYFDNLQSINVLPTSSGKTIITAVLSDRVQKYGRSIVIVPNKSLVVQTEEDYKNLKLDVGVYFGDRKEYNKTHTICTWQSLEVISKRSKNDPDYITLAEFLDGVVAVIVDEVHGAKAASLQKLLNGEAAIIPIRWGMTGTFPKEEFDRTLISMSIGPIVNTLNAKDLQDKGVLSNCDISVHQLQDYKEFPNYPSEMSYLTTDQDRLKFISKFLGQISKVDGNTLILVNNIPTGKLLQKYIPDSVFISGVTKLTDRSAEYSEIATSDNRVLIATYGIAAVGINVPRLFNIVLFEAGKSSIRVLQSIGRGLRTAKDKNHVHIYDICSGCKYSKKHLTKRKSYYKEQQFPHTITKVNWQQ